MSWSNRESLCFFNKLWDQLICVTNEDNNRDGHASLTGGSETSTSEGIDSISRVSVWHDDGVILSSHVRLAPLAVGAALLVDVLSSLVASNEADSLDVWMRANSVDDSTASMDDVANTIRDTRLLQQVHKESEGTWHTLGWLQHEGVSKSDCQGVHPKRDHAREVEWCNTCSDTEWDSVAHAVNSSGEIWHSFSHGKRVERASVLSALVSSEDLTVCIDNCLSVLLRQSLGKKVRVVLEEGLVSKHASDTLSNWSGAPGWEGFLCSLHGSVEVCLGAFWDFAQHILSKWADHIDVLLGGRVDPTAVDVVFEGCSICEASSG